MHPTDSVVVEHLTKTFPTSSSIAVWLRYRGAPPRFRAVDDVSFRVRSGELFGLLGENGAGKSTILQVLCGLMTADSGRIVVNGVDARSASLELRRQYGLCTADDRSFYYRLTARQNLEFFGDLEGIHGRALRRRIEEVLDLVDLRASIDRRFDSFSSGMRQRLAIARALLGDGAVLFLDEPTRAVDPVHAAEIRTFIRSLVVERGKTIVLCTNQLDEAWELCDRVGILAKGHLVAVAAPSELTESGRYRRYAIAFDGMDDEVLARARAIAGVLALSVEAEAGATVMRVELDDAPRSLTDFLRAISGNGVSIAAVRPETRSPFEAFAGLAMGGRDGP